MQGISSLISFSLMHANFVQLFFNMLTSAEPLSVSDLFATPTDGSKMRVAFKVGCIFVVASL